MREHVEIALKELEKAGVKYEQRVLGSGHLEISWQGGEKQHKVVTTITGTQGYRGALNNRAIIRRLLKTDPPKKPNVTSLAKAMTAPKPEDFKTGIEKRLESIENSMQFIEEMLFELLTERKEQETSRIARTSLINENAEKVLSVLGDGKRHKPKDIERVTGLNYNIVFYALNVLVGLKKARKITRGLYCKMEETTDDNRN